MLTIPWLSDTSELGDPTAKMLASSFNTTIFLKLPVVSFVIDDIV